MRAVVLVVVKLGTHLFLQMVLGLVNLLLQTVTSIVANKSGLRSLRRAFTRRFFFHLAEILEARRGSRRRLELMRKHWVLQRLVPLVSRSRWKSIHGREGSW